MVVEIPLTAKHLSVEFPQAVNQMLVELPLKLVELFLFGSRMDVFVFHVHPFQHVHVVQL